MLTHKAFIDAERQADDGHGRNIDGEIKHRLIGAAMGALLRPIADAGGNLQPQQQSCDHQAIGKVQDFEIIAALEIGVGFRAGVSAHARQPGLRGRLRIKLRHGVEHCQLADLDMACRRGHGRQLLVQRQVLGRRHPDHARHA